MQFFLTPIAKNREIASWGPKSIPAARIYSNSSLCLSYVLGQRLKRGRKLLIRL